MASEQVKPRIYSENSGYLLGAGTLTQMGNFLSKGCICVVFLYSSEVVIVLMLLACQLPFIFVSLKVSPSKGTFNKVPSDQR